MKHIAKPLLAFLLAATVNILTFDKIDEKKLFNELDMQVKIPGNWVIDWRTWIHGLNIRGALTQPRNHVKTMQYVDRPLFRAYPELCGLDHSPLCQLPTPVEKLNALSEHLHQSIYIKRDDLTGGYDANGAIRYGGNKPRKLEFLLARAQAHGCRSIITFGCVGSSFAAATAFYGKELGFDVHVLLKPQPNSTVVQKNLLIDHINSAYMHSYQESDLRAIHATLLWLEEYHNTQNFPYVIPTGGSNEIGALGFVNAAFELKEQIDQGLMPEPARIYIPYGSAATTVGLIIGCKLAGLTSTVVAIAVEPEDEVNVYRNNIGVLLEKTIDLLRSYDASIPALTLNDVNLEIYTNFTGTEYGEFTPEGREAMELMKSLENITLDGTYTAKSCAGMIAHIKENRISKDAPILYWNTFCGIMDSEKLRTTSFEQLPPEFHRFYREPVQ